MRFRTTELLFGMLLAVSIFAVGILFSVSYQSPPTTNNQGQQSEAASPYSRSSKATVTESATDGQAAQRKEEKSEFWSAKLTDWLLAVFTLFLVAFTGALVKSTNRLWDAAKEQARITENGFAQLEGPVIEACNITLELRDGPVREGDKPPTVSFWLKNRGRGPGFIGRMCGHFVLLPGGKIPTEPLYKETHISNMALGAGEQTDHPLEYTLEVPTTEDSLIKAGFFFYGFVEYRGVFGGVSTWAWGFEPGDNGRFAIAGGTKYNYRKYDPNK
jgi:hypothetical protein